MKAREWVELFEAINGRSPRKEEFFAAKMAGEFEIEKPQHHLQMQSEERPQMVEQIKNDLHQTLKQAENQLGYLAAKTGEEGNKLHQQLKNGFNHLGQQYQNHFSEPIDEAQSKQLQQTPPPTNQDQSRNIVDWENSEQLTASAEQSRLNSSGTIFEGLTPRAKWCFIGIAFGFLLVAYFGLKSAGGTYYYGSYYEAGSLFFPDRYRNWLVDISDLNKALSGLRMKNLPGALLGYATSVGCIYALGQDKDFIYTWAIKDLVKQEEN